MELGLIVLTAIIIFNVLFMIFVTRMILTEPPHKEPSVHPWVLEYATENGAVEASQDTDLDESTAEAATQDPADTDSDA